MPEPNLTNPELQESLRALEGGDEASLMDATPLGVSALEDNAPLGPEGESGPLHENAGGAQAASLPVPVADVPAGPGGPGAPPGILEREDLYAHLMGERAQAQTDDIALDRDSVDELMAELDKVHARPAPEAAAGSAAEEGPLSQDMLDAIIAAASTEEAVVSENLAAAATTPAPDFDALTQKDLDHIIDKARELGLAIKGLEQGTVPETAPVMPASPRPRLRLNFAFRRPRLLERFTRKTMARLAAALLLGIGVGSGTYVYLTQTPGPESPVPVETSAPPEDLGTAIEQARELSTAGDYAGAVKLLEEPLAEAQEDPRRLDAEYVMMEARVKGFVFEADSPAYMQLHDDLDALVKEDPEHPRAPEALMWKASLYDLDGLHSSAFQTCEDIVRHYPNFKQRDAVLLNLAQMGLKMHRASSTAQYAQQLINEYPGSEHAGEARLSLGQAYEMAGMVAEARTLYVRLAEDAGNTALGNKSLLYLARLAHGRGEYQASTHVLEDLLATTTTTAGSDEAYLLLAQSYRKMARLAEARGTLNDLLKFFPESDVTPRAYVELSQVTELMEGPGAALRIAEQAVARFPDEPEVLKSKGTLLGLTGSPYGAATTLVAAEAAGAQEPGLLLAAVRHYRTAGSPDLALETYRRLVERYPGAPEAYKGGIEQAEMMLESEQPSAAVNQLEELVVMTADTPEHVEVLLALTDLYKELGLTDKVAELAGQIADESKEPEALARTALTLIQANKLEDGLALLERAPGDQLPEPLQYRVEMEAGKALLQIDPARGLEKMEAAYDRFVNQRTAEEEQVLLEAYLKADRTAAARRVVSELEARVKQRPVDTPWLIDAAIKWGDHLYGKADYRAAADAYAIASAAAAQSTPPAAGVTKDARWAVFQHANALLQLSDYEESVKLFDEIAASDAAWAEDARAKADYARLEQRRRGFPVTPAPAPAKAS